MPRGYTHENTSIHLMNYHFVWCPRYRRGMLVGKVKDRLKALVNEKAKTMGSEVIEIEIMPDHIHLFINSTPLMTPNKLIGSIKGYTSRFLREEFPALRRMPTLWTRSYFCSTAGNVSSFVIEKYIKEQEAKKYV